MSRRGWRPFGPAVLALVVLACGGAKDDPPAAPTPAQGTAGSAPSGATGTQRACVPGQSIGCAGPGGCMGYQVCGSDGGHYESCICAAPPEPIAEAGADTADANPANAFTLACMAPDGQPLSMTSAEVSAALAGRWWLCGGAAEFYYPVEFTADGHWYKLTNFGGSFQRNHGMDTSGTFTIATQDTPSIAFSMVVTFANGMAASGYSLAGSMQSTPPGLMRLGGGLHLRMAP